MNLRSACALLWLFALCCASHAQTNTAWSVPWCTAEMLDARLLLPSDLMQKTLSSGLLSVELQNRGKKPCHLVDFLIHLPAQNAYNQRFASGQDHSAAARKLADAQSLLAPGEQVHQVIAWSTAPQIKDRPTWDNCLSSDGLTATVGRGESILKVEHLWLLQCGQAWMSSMRAGPFVRGEELSDDWLRLYSLHRSDVAEPPPPVSAKLSSSNAISYLPGTFESGYNGWLTLALERPSNSVGECGFQMLRRREEDGQTTILVNHCPVRNAHKLSGSPQFVDVMLREYGMLPERVGHVEYELITGTVHDGKSFAASGVATVEVRDPIDPMLPIIETTLKPCRPEQLTLKATVKIGNQIDLASLKPLADVPREGRVYTFANNSGETCLIGGTPALTVVVEPGTSGNTIGLGVCRDCSDALFRARGQHWIALGPARPAHFIITSRPATGINNTACHAPSWIAFAGTAGKNRMPYGLRSCGQIDVSAWRDGAYDDDPLNLRLPNATSLEKTSPLPAACVGEATAESGLPFFFPGKGAVQFGLSSLPSSYRDGAPVALWVSNPSDKEVSLMSCEDYDGFFVGGFDVLDQTGNRVLEKQEVEADHPVMRQLMACTANVPVQIPPHSCRHGYPDKSSPFKLGSLYTLPAGHYEVVPRGAQGSARLTEGLSINVTP